jgi:hypothetical protein
LIGAALLAGPAVGLGFSVSEGIKAVEHYGAMNANLDQIDKNNREVSEALFNGDSSPKVSDLTVENRELFDRSMFIEQPKAIEHTAKSSMATAATVVLLTAERLAVNGVAARGRRNVNGPNTGDGVQA